MKRFPALTLPRRRLLGACLAAGALPWLAGCAAPDVKHYQAETPALDLVQYFSGPTEAWGMVQMRSGEVARRFHVRLNGRTEGNRLVLDEDFRYSDGSTQQRTWTLTPQGPGRWLGTAPDIVGQATGEVAGNTLHWRYTLRVPVDGREVDLDMDDWMYLIDPQTLVNRTSMRKWGVEVGQVTLFFRKL